MRNLFVAMILMISAQQVVAQAPSPRVRILVPVYIGQPVPGAYGSLWQSQFAMHNGSFLRYTIATCPPNQDCRLDLSDDEELVQGETQVGLPRRYPLPLNPVGGTLLYLASNPPQDASAVAFQLRVVDLSRSATAAGTELPVVREKGFRSSTVHLLNIPTDTRFRLALRVFEMNLGQARFAVRIIDQSTDAVLSSRLVTTTTSVAPGGFVPGFAELGDLLSGVSSQTTHLRVEIEPFTTGVAFWSYASITNNDSQQFTIVTPQ